MGNRVQHARLLDAAKKTSKVAAAVEEKWDQVGAALWVLNRRTKRHRIALCILLGMWIGLAARVLWLR